MKLQINKEESPFDGMWLLEKNYCLHNDIISGELRKKTLLQTGLKLTDVNGFWVPAKGGQVEMTWAQLIEFACKILNSEATRLLCNSMWLEELPEVEIKNIEPLELPIHNIQTTKRLKLAAGWLNVGNNTTTMLSKYKFHGVDTREGAEGTWIHWISIACKILSCENTNKCAPELFCKELDFDFLS